MKNNYIQPKTSYDSLDNCQLLDILSEDSSLYKVDIDGYFAKAIFRLSFSSRIRPYRTCEFAGCHYSSFSLKKSLYKLNLLQWMDYFKCKKATILRQNANQGQFTKAELRMIANSMIQSKLPESERSDDYILIDTMLLYRPAILTERTI